jgi:hypothetical protein
MAGLNLCGFSDLLTRYKKAEVELQEASYNFNNLPEFCP